MIKKKDFVGLSQKAVGHRIEAVAGVAVRADVAVVADLAARAGVAVWAVATDETV